MYIFRLANTSRDHLFDRSACRCFGAYSIKMLVNIAHVLSYIPARHTHSHTQIKAHTPTHAHTDRYCWATYVVRITLLCHKCLLLFVQNVDVCFSPSSFSPSPCQAVAFTPPAVDFTLSPLFKPCSSAWPHHQQQRRRQDLYPRPVAQPCVTRRKC